MWHKPRYWDALKPPQMILMCLTIHLAGAQNSRGSQSGWPATTTSPWNLSEIQIIRSHVALHNLLFTRNSGSGKTTLSSIKDPPDMVAIYLPTTFSSQSTSLPTLNSVLTSLAGDCGAPSSFRTTALYHRPPRISVGYCSLFPLN